MRLIIDEGIIVLRHSGIPPSIDDVQHSFRALYAVRYCHNNIQINTNQGKYWKNQKRQKETEERAYSFLKVP